MSESVKAWTDRPTHGRTDGRRLESHPISSPRAFGSGELKIQPKSPNKTIEANFWVKIRIWSTQESDVHWA